MLQLKNPTPLAAAFAVCPDAAGVDTLYVAVKATFALRPQLALAPKPLPPITADAYHGDPSGSSIKQATEMHLCKPATDVLLFGHAHAQGGRAVPQAAVRVTVAERQKTAVIFGDRVWKRGGAASAPEPFVKIPLVYERAYGGSQTIGTQVLADECNPVGRGFLGRRSPDDWIGQMAPNIEDPQHLISRLGDAPAPVGFAPIAPGWAARRRFAGTYDATWQRTRAPYLPTDFSPRFFNIAPDPFVFDRYLQGGEPVQLLGLCPEGGFVFNLPHINTNVAVKIAGNLSKPEMNLETVAFYPDDGVMTLLWRGALPCDKQVLKVQEIHVDAAGLGPYEPRGAAA